MAGMYLFSVTIPDSYPHKPPVVKVSLGSRARPHCPVLAFTDSFASRFSRETVHFALIPTSMRGVRFA